MADFVKELFGALDKVTDILNLGRLIFYTAAGLPPVIAVSMILRTVTVTGKDYWTQFNADFVAGVSNYIVWIGAVIAGFLIANVAYVQTMGLLKTEKEDEIADREGFSFLYPRLRTGRWKRAQNETDFDFAAWLIAEYYRYVEIAVYIPYGTLLSLPLLICYSVARILLESQNPARLDGCLFGLALWTTLTGLSWTLFWFRFWVPQIATPIFRTYVSASAGLISGLKDYNEGAATEVILPKDTKKEKS